MNPEDSEIKKILTDARIIALVGASSSQIRPAHGIMRMLLSEGYTVIPVNPREQDVLGQKCYPSLSDIPKDIKIDIVNVFRRAETTPPLAAEAVGIGAKTFWLQLGIMNEEAAEIAKKGGLTVIMNRCIAVDHRNFRVPSIFQQ